MTLKTLTASVLCLALLPVTALAQAKTACEPQTVAAAIDLYSAEPFGARSWRVLQGLGDPMIEPAAVDSDTWAMQEKWKTLTGEVLPGNPGLQDVSWNCRIGYPLSVLEKRVGSLGKDHPYVKQWLGVQDQVLRSCGSNEAEVAMPPPAEVDPAYVNLQRMDRAYQEASIAFYRDKAKALDLFRKIAETGSPHRAAARYNIANLLANAKQPEAARQEAEAILADPSLASVHRITRELLGYIAHQEDTAASWSRLINADIETLSAPLADIRANPDLARQYASALYDIDFAGIRAKDGSWWLDGTLPADATISKSIVDATRQHPMALWMIAGQSAGAKSDLAPWSLNGSLWQDRMNAYVSKALAVAPSGAELQGPARQMLSAIGMTPDAASRQEIWRQALSAAAAANDSCAEAAETAAAGFLLAQATRLSALAGAYDEAASALQSVPFKTARAYMMGAVFPLIQTAAGQGDVAAARKLRDQLLTAESLEGLPREGASADRDRLSALLAYIAEDDAKFIQAVQMHSDPASNVIFNFLPTKTLWALASDASFAERERALFARAAWTRDYALSREIDGKAQESFLALNPALRDVAAGVAADYPELSPRRQRLLSVLRAPAHNILISMPGPWMAESIQPDSATAIDGYNPNDRNWWCPFETDRQLGALRDQADSLLGLPADGSYVERRLAEDLDPALRDDRRKTRDEVLKAHPMVQAVDWKEIRALSRMPQAPRKLTDAALRTARKADPKDMAAAEALALAVRTTRYGCNWHGGHGSYSKAAQQLLTKRFAGSDWQIKTPYWFDCRRSEWSADFSEKTLTCTPKTWPKQAPLKR